MTRSLALRREALTELGDTDLAEVAGGCQPALSCQIVKCWVPEPRLTDTCPSNTGC